MTLRYDIIISLIKKVRALTIVSASGTVILFIIILFLFNEQSKAMKVSTGMLIDYAWNQAFADGLQDIFSLRVIALLSINYFKKNSQF